MKLIKSLLLTIVTFSLSCGYLKAEEEKVDFGALFAQQNEFLEVDDAFVQQVDVFDDEIIVKFEIADEYYMYRSRFAFKAEGATLGDAYIPRGKKKVDEYLGDVEVYYHNLEISVPFTAHQEAFTFIYEFQGCAEAGLCYPPEEKTITLYADKIVPNAGIENSSIETKVAEVVVDEYVPEEKQVENFLSDKSLLEIVIYFVLLGIGLAFTPCVLPMVPILSSIIVGQGENLSRGKAFGLSLTYTQAMAIPYTLMGVFFGAAGESLSNTLQEPLFIGIAAAVFVLLSLAMFGFYELQLPQSWQNKLNNISRNQETGSYIGAGIMGILSALVVSPCVTAPLAGILIYIGQTGNEVTGGVALYSLAVGMGIPLIIVGVGGKSLLPKSGGWMNAVKAGFGVVMLGMALYISKHLIPGPLYLFAWAALLIVTSIYMGAFSQVETNGKKFWKGIGLLMFIYGMTLVVGAAMSNKSLLSPLAGIQSLGSGNAQQKSIDVHAGFERVKTIADVEAKIEEANTQGKTVMFDFFAESCTACYEFAEFTFPHPDVQAALANTVLIQADVTANDAEDKALMKHFKIVGLPSILFFDLDGNEVTYYRAAGFEGAERFSLRIKAAFGLTE